VDERDRKNFQIALISILVVVFVLLVAMGYLLFNAPRETEIIRDISVIVLALESIVMLLLLIVVIAMLWWLIRTLERKITPILDSTNQTVNAVGDTVNTVRGTAAFVSDTVVSPIIEIRSYAQGVKSAIQVLTRLRSKRRD